MRGKKRERVYVRARAVAGMRTCARPRDNAVRAEGEFAPGAAAAPWSCRGTRCAFASISGAVRVGGLRDRARGVRSGERDEGDRARGGF